MHGKEQPGGPGALRSLEQEVLQTAAASEQVRTAHCLSAQDVQAQLLVMEYIQSTCQPGLAITVAVGLPDGTVHATLCYMSCLLCCSVEKQ